ncbi:hypothetical protein [Weissella muntiaci]|uniref:hypothetical protein n=1 Tax=Weissella muntiaci TaxID=2508881 RepID=UPI001651FA78|nr:hypothetical protein [Weissella muntiaci]
MREENKSKIRYRERDLEDFLKQQRSFEQSDIALNDTLNTAYSRLRELNESNRRWVKYN